MFVLGGFVPGVTATVSRVVSFTIRVFGVELPEPDGGVEVVPELGTKATPR
jgi:hypothetical protein